MTSSEPAPYALANPSGTAETTRLTLQHHIWLQQHNHSLHCTPLSPITPQNVLDLCCGTGIWTFAFASTNPTSTVLGVDITPPAPTAETQSQHVNVEFAYGDAEGDWDFARIRKPFTFIYGRMLNNSIRHWDHTFTQALKYLAPGGFFQLDDIAHAFFAEDVSVTESHSPMMRWWRVIFQAASTDNGIDVNATYKHTGRLREAGFRLHRAELVRWYLGGGKRPTEKENTIADMWLEDIVSLIPVVTQNAIKQGSVKEITVDEAGVLAEEAVRDIKEYGAQRGYYTEFLIHVAQKGL